MQRHGAPSLRTLFEQVQVWQASARRAPLAGMRTGIASLDAALPTGGWPAAALTEILLPAFGLHEFGLLMPTLAHLTRNRQRIALIAPPFIPYAPAWQAAGIRLDHVDVIDSTDATSALWAFEQCLRAACHGAVLGWPDHATPAQLRRLQVAADQGKTPGFVLRHQRHAVQASPAALRLHILPGQRLKLIKCRGGSVPTHILPFSQDEYIPQEHSHMLPCGLHATAARKMSGPHDTLQQAVESTGSMHCARLTPC